MEQRTLRAAVIGVGSMGRNHARVYASMPGVELVAVCDTNIAAANSLASIYRCHVYTDYHDMLRSEDLDLVSVVVPTKYHFAVASAVIGHGVHVLIEKPIAATVEQGWMLIEAAQRQGVILTVGHIERFNPAIIALKEQLNNHELGNLFQIMSRRVGPFPARIMDVGV
ncbi:MAG: Gfo/Idh/MocA family oxidoreductase, partial [Chloroflexus sp.]